MAENTTASGVEVLYDSWLRAWRTMDINLMVSLFDRDYGSLTYQAEEHERPSTSYEQIVAYWKNAPSILERVSEWSEVEKTIALSGNCVTIFAILMTRLKATFSPKEIAGKLRVSIVAHKKNDRWAIIHYHESRQLLIEQKQGTWTLGADAKFLD